MEFKIVGSTEANSLEGKISNESPVGQALMGKKVNDVVDVETQAGVIQYKVLDIQRIIIKIKWVAAQKRLKQQTKEQDMEGEQNQNQKMHRNGYESVEKGSQINCNCRTEEIRSRLQSLIRHIIHLR